jgi:nucleosome binding factor SPN SPT16 subunit
VKNWFQAFAFKHSLYRYAGDIEVVNLERVGFHLKNFDMAIIFKDFTRDVHRIDQIPVQNLDNIKQWLGTLDIKYYEVGGLCTT